MTTEAQKHTEELDSMAYAVLRHNQRQLDNDGIEVAVSRQALDMALDYIDAQQARTESGPTEATDWKQRADTASHNAKHYADLCVRLEGDLEMSNDALGTARGVLIENGFPDLPFLCDGIQNAINMARTKSGLVKELVEALEALRVNPAGWTSDNGWRITQNNTITNCVNAVRSFFASRSESASPKAKPTTHKEEA